MFFITNFFQPFWIFLYENNTKQDDFNTFRKIREGATIIVSWENPKKGSADLKRDNDTDRLQKSVYIHTFIFIGTYTGSPCQNLVESRPIPEDSSFTPEDSSSIPLEFSGILWNLAESMHSCRNLWGIKKYRKIMKLHYNYIGTITSRSTNFYWYKRTTHCDKGALLWWSYSGVILFIGIATKLMS